MAYLDMEGMEDMEASEIVDMANVQPNVVSPEIVDIDDMGKPVVSDEIVNLGEFGAVAPMRRKQMPASRMMPQQRTMTQRQAAPNLIVQGLGAVAAARPAAPMVSMTQVRQAVMQVQRWINAQAFGPGSGRHPITVDGIWGPQTEWGFGLAGLVAARLGGSFRLVLDARNAYLADAARR